ncbi:MAG: EAL domain-containing protein [Oscillospiraceae bacterium]|nr:EAL domain-containing protein [Oscillospiraceae bacterium]
MNEAQRQQRIQILNDTFDAFAMLAGGNYVTLYDVKSQITRWSPGAVELFGLPGEYIPYGAYNWSDYVHPDDVAHYEEEMGSLEAEGKLSYDISYRVRTRDGRYGMFRMLGAVIRDDDGSPSLIGGMIVNQGVLEHTDALTVLRNQYGFFSDLSAVMKTGRPHTILMLGVSNLNRVNKAYGYGYGNRVLQEVGMLMQEQVGVDGTLYRLNGSKFAVITSKLSDGETEKLYEVLRRRLRREIRVNGIRHALIASGSMISVQGGETDPRTVFSCLNYAYRESRDRLHGSLVPFNTGVSLDRIKAVRDDVIAGCTGFYLHYQPVVDTDTRRPIGAEALVRWNSPPWGELSPGQFLPPLEQDTLFEELGNWILSKAMTDGKRLLAHDPGFLVGINVTAGQLEKEYFVDTLRETLRETGFPPDNLSLELSADCRLLDFDLLRSTAAELKSLGVRYVLDDFASGADSLGCLKALAPDFVKLDPRLLSGIAGSDADREALNSLTGLVRAYGAEVCVKCVENDQLDRLLKQYPIRELQGWLYMPPVPLEKLISAYYECGNEIM